MRGGLALAVALVCALVVPPARAQDRWESRPGPQQPRQEVAYVEAGGKLYLAGGIRSLGLDLFTDRHERFDPATGAWQAVARLPGPAHHLQGVAVGGKIYYVGGLRGYPFSVVGAVWEYDPATNSFSSRRPMPADRARGASGSAVLDGKVYVTGGQRGGRPTALFDVYDPATETWTALPDMPSAREHHGAAFVADRLFVVGGRLIRNDAYVTATEAYDVSEGRWITGLRPIPTGRGGLSVAALHGEVYAIGGQGGGRAHAEAAAYDPQTNTWRELPPMPTPRHGAQGAVFQDGIWIAAGGTDEGFATSKVHEVLFPASPPRSLPAPAKPRIRLAVTPRRVRAGVRTRFRFRAATADRRPVRRALIRFVGRRARTDRAGRAVIATRIHRTGRRQAIATRRGLRRGTAMVVVAARARAAALGAAPPTSR